MLQFLKVLLGLTIAIIGSLVFLAAGVVVVAYIPTWINYTIGIIVAAIPFILLVVAETKRINSQRN